MKPSDIWSYQRSCDRKAIGELLELEGQYLTFYELRFVKCLLLYQIADQLGYSYSKVAHLSSDVNKLIDTIDL